MTTNTTDTAERSFGDTVFLNLFNTFVKPDVKRRIDVGELPNPFHLASLRALQIVFYPDGRKPVVRLDGEVRAYAEVKAKPGVTIAKGDPVSFDHIESLGPVSLTEEEADYGHATFIREPNGGWIGTFDFIYYKATAQRHLDVADQFLHAAQACRENRYWAAFADTLFSAAELAAKASLYCLDISKDIVTTKKHHTVSARFNKQRHLGNVDAAHAKAFNRLWDLRQKGRYVHQEVAFDDQEADQLLNDVRSLVEESRSRPGPFGPARDNPTGAAADRS